MLKFQAEITDMLVFARNYWSSCRVFPWDETLTSDLDTDLDYTYRPLLNKSAFH